MAASAPQARLPGVTLVVLTATILALLGWLFFITRLLHAHQLGATGMFPDDRPFTDFYLYKPTFDSFHTAGFFHPTPPTSRFAYPPLDAPIYQAFYSLQHRISVYLLLTACVWTSLIAWVLFESRQGSPGRLGKWALLLVPSLSYPAIFLVERGNLELFVWAATAAGMVLFARRRHHAAAVLFGLAAALKLYPILLLGLFLKEKRALQSISLGLATFVVSTLLALWYAGPSLGVAAHGFSGGVGGFQSQYGNLIRLAELRFDHSFFSVWKVAAAGHPGSLPMLSRIYYGLCALVGTAAFFARVIYLPWSNRLVFLSACMLLLPPVSYEYTLVHLYLPLFLLVLLGMQNRVRGALLVAVSGLCALLLPGDLLSFGPRFQAGQVQALLLLVVATSALFRFVDPLERTQQPQDVSVPTDIFPAQAKLANRP